ncbi:MAG: guanine deaminase [Gemmatimonadales bacterium]|nr:guanine deaminase [Gemmatimonadales bacterium]
MTDTHHALVAIRGRFLDVAAVCDNASLIEENIRHHEDGLLLIKEGRIEWFGDWNKGQEIIPANCLLHHHHRDKLIVPGFVDTHLHFPQAEIVGSYGEQLLQWLENHAFPAEKQFHDAAHATEMADFFIDQLLRNGTTTASVFCSVHPRSVVALFEAAEQINMRVIAGKVMMDRNAPQELLDSPKSSYCESKALIEKYHKRGRLLYAITPRFAPTSTPEQLEMAGKLKQEFPDAYIQTHLSENLEEIEWVKKLFPEQDNYFDVYHHHGLTGPRSIFAHCVHLEAQEWDRLHETDSAISFCPTSNLFLGSGLFDMQKAREKKIRIGMATDIGGGTTYSMLQTLSEAYKVMQLQGQRFTPWDAFYLATLGGARALSLDHLIGNFDTGKEADFVVLDPQATPLQTRQFKRAENSADLLFSLIVLGDERSISHTYVDGCLVHERPVKEKTFRRSCE